MGTKLSRALLCLGLMTGSGCGPSETECRKVIEGKGMTDIVMTRAGDGFDFTAKQGKLSCKGHVSSAGGNSMLTSTCADETPPDTSNFKPDCDAQHATACYEQAKAKAGANDHAGAVQLYTKGCEFGDAPSCNDLGVAYNRGKGVAEDGEQARTFYDKACKGKLDLGCLNHGRSLNAAGKYEEAKPLVQTACDKGMAGGCYELGVAYMKGEQKDGAKALEALKKGCEQQPEPSADACGAMGVIYAQGFPGIPADLAKAEELLSSGCEKSSFESCKNLGILVRDGRVKSKDKGRAIELFTKACEGEDGIACNELGIIYDKGTNTPKDLTKAAGLYDRACTLGELIGCMNAGIALKDGAGVSKDLTKAADLLEKACKGGVERACTAGKTLPKR